MSLSDTPEHRCHMHGMRCIQWQLHSCSANCGSTDSATHIPVSFPPRPPCLLLCSAAPVNFSGTSLSNPYTNLYNTVELPGVFKSISLTSYSPDQVKNGWNQDQEQFKWLEQQLQQVAGQITGGSVCAMAALAGVLTDHPSETCLKCT